MATNLKREGNTATLIYDRLRAEILNGNLKPGTPLSQLTIARENGTSRAPVREALRRLQQDQLVIGHANRRFNVAPFDMTDLEMVLSLQLANVTLAIRAGVPFLQPDDIVTLEKCLGAMERAVYVDKEAWEAAYRGFILTLIGRSGDRAVSVVDNLIDNIQRYRASLLDRFPRVHAGGPEFSLILEAARSGDAAKAAIGYADYFGRLSSLILAGASPRYDPARLRSYIAALVPSEPV